MIDHPVLDKLHVRLTQLTELCVLANDPLTITGGGSKSANKPESKSPGYQQCTKAVRDAERILTRAVKDLEAAWNAANIREHHGGDIESIGGVNVRHASSDQTGSVLRVSRVKNHLAGKYAAKEDAQ